MNPEQIKKLIGGYATGTLTPEEREVLFAAALEDQDLFDELAREQPLRDLLQEPAARAQLLTALDETPRRRFVWLPGWGSLAAAMAGVAVIAILLVRPGIRPAMEVKVAQLRDAGPQPIAPPSAPAGTETGIAMPDKPKPAKRPGAAVRRFAPPVQVSATEPAPLAGAPPAVSAPPAPAPPAALMEPATPLQTPRELFYASSGFAPRQNAVSASLPVEAQAKNAPDSARPMAAAPALRRTASAAPAPNLGVKYTILRRGQGGELSEAGPDDLKNGDVVQIRLEPNASGFLTVTAHGSGEGRQLLSRNVERLGSYTTPPLKAGETEVAVTFSRKPETLLTAASVVGRNRTEEAANERATYVVSDPVSGLVRFTIRLNYK